MREARGGRRCEIGRRVRCSGPATKWGVGLRGSGGGGALAGRKWRGGREISDDTAG